MTTETTKALAEQCAIYREQIAALESECEQLRDNLRHMTESRDNQTVLLDHWKAKAAESLTKMQRVDALEALAVELAGALDSLLYAAIEVGELPPDYGQTRKARRALSSPLLAELRAKEASHG